MAGGWLVQVDSTGIDGKLWTVQSVEWRRLRFHTENQSVMGHKRDCWVFPATERETSLSVSGRYYWKWAMKRFLNRSLSTVICHEFSAVGLFRGMVPEASAEESARKLL